MDIHYTLDGTDHVKTVVLADSSYRFQEVMGDHSVTLNFSLTEYFVFPVGSWILCENVKYRLFDEAESTVKQNERNFEYTLVFHDPAAWLKRFKMRNMVDGRLAFTLTAQPFEYIDHICDNLNARETGNIWRRGDCIVSAEKTQSFSHNSISDALNSVAQLFETEWEIKLAGADVSTGVPIYEIALKKVEYNKLAAASNNAQRLEYGKGNGLLSGIEKTKGDGNAVDVVWVEGGDRNIDSQTYTYEKWIGEGANRPLETFHSNKLRLPRGGQFYYVPPTNDTDKGTIFTAAEIQAMFPDEHQGEINDWLRENNVQIYLTDADGFGLHRRTQDYVNNGYEESLELTDIYPCLKLEVSAVYLTDYTDVPNPDPAKYSNRFWNIQAFECPVDYNQCLIGGEEPTVIFNSGMLAGKEFNLANQNTEENPKIYDVATQFFYIQPTEIDGIVMPDLPIDIRDKDQKAGTGYIPAIGDEFAVFHVSMPPYYIEKAEKELLLEACYYLYQHGEIEVQFSCTLDGIFSRNKWETMRQYFVVGGYINFVDKDFCQDGRLLRILSIKDYINRPHAPELTLSNSTVSQSVSSELKKVAQNQVYQTANYADAVQFSKRNFRDAQQTQTKIAEAFTKEIANVNEALTEQITNVISDLDITNNYFTDSINPATIQTMSLLVGDKNLQFQFGHATVDGENVVQTWNRHTYEPKWANGVLTCPDTVTTPSGTLAAHVRHDYWTRNKDENEITTDTAANHPYWIVNAAVLSQDGNGANLDPNKAYYLYLQCPSGAATVQGWGKLEYYANFRLYAEPHSHSGDDFYLMVGILNAEFNGSRSYVDVYSSVEITGGQIRIDKIVSQDGSTYIDLINNAIGGRLIFQDGLISNAVGIGDGANAYAGIGGRDQYRGDAQIILPWSQTYDNKFNKGVALWAGKWLGESAQIDYIYASTLVLEDGTIIMRTNDATHLLRMYADPTSGNVLISSLYSATIHADEVVSGSVKAGQYGIAGTSAYSPYVYADNFVRQFNQGGNTINAFAPALIWSGSITYASNSYSASADSANYDITVTATRTDTGYVTLTYNKQLPSSYFVTALGQGLTGNPLYVTIKDKSGSGMEILLSDDNTRNDGNCYLQLWYLSVPSRANRPGVYDSDSGTWIKTY